MPGFRTYIPGLRFVLRRAVKYIKDWQPQIQEHVDSNTYDHVVTCLEGLESCLALLG